MHVSIKFQRVFASFNRVAEKVRFGCVLKGHDFIGCGKTRSSRDFEGLVKGHDFSRANKANQINVGLQPLQMPIPTNSSE